MLTDTKIRNLKPKSNQYRVADSHGLVIEINPNGSRLWRHRYRYNSKATMMSLGSYPLVSLLDARQARDNNKQMLKQGINPKQEKSLSNSIIEVSEIDVVSKSMPIPSKSSIKKFALSR